jgi:glycyl-tRNA synthetase beta chain
MYWDDPAIRFGRPIRWLVALYGEEVLPLRLGRIESGRITRGHRFLGARSIELGSPREYLDRLYDEFVLADGEKRREKLLSGVSAIEKELGGRVELDPDLVDENNNLVEYPVAFWGSFDPAFLEVPEEALTTSMKKNQRYFPVRDAHGKLLPYFVGISNNRATRMEVVREGNERVLRARLSDAAFFFREDQKTPLADRVESLKAILYQEQLGSVHDKVQRARDLAVRLARRLGREELVPLVDRAALLSKADLTTSMVYEFPELQGIMGREYARRSGEPERVALAISEQYLPRSATDRLPTDAVGAILGVADRADTIAAICKIGQEPTSSADPYGLRRAVRTIDEILFGLEMDVDVAWLLAEAGRGLQAPQEAVDKALDFFRQRLHIQLREKGFSHGAVSLAIRAVGDRPLQVLRLARVLEEQRQSVWFGELLTSAVRVRNILAKAPEASGEPREDLLVLEAERELLAALSELEPKIEAAVRESDWLALAEALHALSPAIARFFDQVLVMDEDPGVRENRLALLRKAKRFFDNVGDLALLKS